MSSTLISLLENYSNTMSEILHVSGTPGMSIGVFHHGKIIHTKHFGQREVPSSHAPDDDTTYHIASLTKLLTLCAVGSLVTEGVLAWDTPICDYLPAFRTRLDDAGSRATLRDVASNRTGLASADFFWGQQNGHVLTPKDELISIATTIPALKPFRESFIYSPWNYILIHAIIEKVTGKAFGQVLKERIVDPLGLKKTTFEDPEGTNLAYPHAVRDDGSIARIPMIPLTSHTGLTAVMGGKSTLPDMLAIYIAILSAYSHQKQNNVNCTPNSPFAQLCSIFEPHVPVDKSTPMATQAYCLGVYRTILPGNLSRASLNASLLRKDIHTFGLGTGTGPTLQGVEILHHTGNLPGYFHSMFLAPDIQSGVVCMSNGTPLMDPTDFSAQLLLGIILGSRSSPQDLTLAEDAKQSQLAWYARLSKHLREHKTTRLPSLPISKYSGTYSNQLGNFAIHIVPAGVGLRAYMQGHVLTTYELLPLDGDTFYWEANRDQEICDKAMLPSPFLATHLVNFQTGTKGVMSLNWHIDPLARPHQFCKTSRRGFNRL